MHKHVYFSKPQKIPFQWENKTGALFSRNLATAIFPRPVKCVLGYNALLARESGYGFRLEAALTGVRIPMK